MTTGVHSGKYGVVNGQETVREWTITDNLSLTRYVASNTLIGSGRKNGIRAWSGSFSQYGHKPTLLPNDVFAFRGYTAPTDPGVSPAGLVYFGQARVSQVAVTWNWESNEIISTETQFTGHLALATEHETEVDISVPDPLTPSGTKIEADDVEIPNLTTATLTLTADVQTYVNSSTHITGHTWTGVRNGPIDWTLAVTMQDVRRGAPVPTIGSDSELKLYVDDTDFWLLEWGQLGDITGISVNRESGAIIQQTLNFAMNGFNDGEVGQIVLPGEVSPWWPASAS